MAKHSRQKSLPGWDEPDGTPPEVDGIEDRAAPAPAKPCGPQPESLAGQTVYVVDSHSLIHQVFHALPEMTSPKGEPVQAVYGFARDIFFLLQMKKPDYLFCAFDLPGKTFRHDLYEQYKAGRPEMDIDLVPQIAHVQRLIEAMGIPVLGCPSYEADDLLATVARLTEELGGECFLVTADKDCRQLITERVRVYNIRKNMVLDRQALVEEWGIGPEQVVDYQALVGDPTDNVPGVPLIGPKGAQQLLSQYGTLEGVLAHANEVSGAKKKENLLKYGQQALLSRQLARLDSHVPVTIDWNAGRVVEFDRTRVSRLLAELCLRSLATKVDVLAASEPVAETTVKAPSAYTYHLVDTPEAFDALLRQLHSQRWFSFDTETTHTWPRWAELVGCSFAWNEREAWYIPVRAPADNQRLEPEKVLQALKPILEDPAVGKIGQNLKYDMIVLRSACVHLAGIEFDTMLASYLLDAGGRTHNLDDLAKRYLDHDTIKIGELIGTGKNQKRMDEVPTRLVADYAGEDALVPVLLRPILETRLRRENLWPLFAEVEIPLIHVLAEMEFNGVKVDVARLAEMSDRFGRHMDALEREIHELAGQRFNLASPKQLQEILFGKLGLPVMKKTKTGASTDVEVLEDLAPLHPLPAKIMEHRQYAKLKSTYVDALPTMVCPATGRVHTSFKQDVAATGRLSSSDPNLQNIPVRTDEGKQIRSAFVAGQPDWLLLSADYSQIELRVLAHFSEDPRLCGAFANDEDIHARVAAEVNKVPLEEVTDAMRRQAKAVNFGVIYGQSPFGLAKQLGIEQSEAARFIDAYFEGYAGVERFLSQILVDCRQNGYVNTILGRRRAIEGVRDSGGRQRNLAERTAINTVIQGSAADLIKLAMLAVDRRLRREASPARMLLQIHDELVFETPSDHVTYLAKLVTEEMVGVRALRVPLKVDVQVGPNWADVQSWP